MSSLESVIEALVGSLGAKAQPAAPLGALTTYRVGGRAAVLVTAETADDLRTIGDVLSVDGDEVVPILVVGRGSNMLVADAGFAGVAVLLGEGLASVDITGTSVCAGGAAALPVVARRTVAAGLTGFEWAVGVPGSIGGAIRMNAGGHGSDMAASVTGVRVIDLRTGEDGSMQVAALEFGYRSSAVRSHQVVVDCTLELALGPSAAGESALGDIVRWRREHQPGGANAGSVFTNPRGESAGRLIDEAGLKGYRLGSAEISTKHANFIQSDPDGSADDIAALMAEIRRRVVESAGVDLHAETHLVGFDPWVAADAGTGA